MSTHIFFPTSEMTGSLEEKAKKLFDMVAQRSWLQRWQSFRSPQGLMVFGETAGDTAFFEFKNLGQTMVALQKIRGTMNAGRALDFDGNFCPKNQKNRPRWIRLVVARQRGTKLPPVKLVQVGDLFFVEDGHHRISVARALEDEFILAEVTALGEKTR